LRTSAADARGWLSCSRAPSQDSTGVANVEVLKLTAQTLSAAGLGRLAAEHYADSLQVRARFARVRPCARSSLTPSLFAFAQRRLRTTALPSFWARFDRLRPAFAAAAAAAASAGAARASASAALDCGAPRVFLRADLAWLPAALEEGLPALTAAIRDASALAERIAGAVERGAASAAPQPGPPATAALRSGLQARMHAAVLASAEVPFGEALTAYYAQQLHAFAAARGHPARADSDAEDDDEMESEDGGDDAMEGIEADEAEPAYDSPRSAAWRDSLAAVGSALAALGLAALAEEALAGATAAAVRARLSACARGSFGRAALAPARRWLAAVPLAFLAAALPGQAREQLGAWRARLEYALCSALGSLRTDELFDIVVDFPDSMPAVADLRACLEATSLAATLPAAFRAALRRRLLHAGAATADILTHYLHTIKALALLDPSGALLEAVSPPTRAYLRCRRDTIRCVVTLLTEGDADAAESVLEELARDGDGAPADDGDGADSDADGDAPPPPAGAGWASWSPAPAHAAALAARRAPDVVALLVGIFGSRELFVAEYRALLAERVLGRVAHSAEAEERDVRTVELLKLRFGEPPLHAAEVMLKDIADSRRIDAAVKAALPAPRPGAPALPPPPPPAVAATVISQIFWPQFGTDAAAECALPPPVEAALSAYGARFEALKAPRKLLWHRSLGCVCLELSLGGATRRFTVQPLQAAVAWRFGERDAWRAADLAAALQLEQPALRKRAAFWVTAGVLRETRDAAGEPGYALADAFAEADSAGASAAAAPEDGGGALASAEEQAAAESASYEQYIVGMLTNFEALSLERIHNMLKMFVADPPYDKTTAQLEQLLASLCAQEKITLEAGAYRRPRASSQ
jgi:anaphase-promoting complex subunit 2